MIRRTTALLTALLLLSLPAVPATAQTSPAVTVGPTDADNEGVRQNQFLQIDGTGLPDGDITAARLIGRDAGGTQSVQPIASADLNIPPRNGNYLQNDGGSLDGQILLTCVFGPPSSCGTPHNGNVSVQLELTVAGSTLTSNLFPVDYTGPRVLRYDLTSQNTVVVVFSEPVRIPAASPFNTDRPGDWALTDPNASVISVSQGPTACSPPNPDPDRTCSRQLNFSPPVGPDTTPRVDYDANRTALGDPYEDYAGNRIEGFTTVQRAVDRIRPAVPEIDTVAGEAPDPDRTFACAVPVSAGQDSNVVAPTLQLSGLTPGHTLEVRAQRGTRTPQTYTVNVTAASQSVQLANPALTPDSDDIALTVVAIDTNGNRSTQTGSPPNGTSDGDLNPICLRLDTIAPLPVSATQTGDGGTRVLVTFSEPLAAQPVSSGTWTLGQQQATQVAAGQAPNQRLLTFATAPSAGDLLSWVGSEGSRYTDLVGNVLADIDGFPVTLIPAPAAPVFTAPQPGIVTNATSLPVAGTQQPQSGQTLAVQLYSDAAGTESTGDPLPVGNGRWSGTAALPGGSPADQDVTLHARTVNTGLGMRSGVVSSATVTVDRVAPDDVEITQPTSESILGGPAATVGPGVLEVRWTATDPNPGSFSLTMADAAGDAIDCEAQAWGQGNDFTGSCEVPEDVARGDATITLAAVDAATNRTTVTSVPIPLDPDLLTATATLTSNGATLSPGQITLDYSEPLTGNTAFEDWRADDGRSGAVNRRPASAQVAGDRTRVVLDFAATFPPGSAHPNAQPRYTYDTTLGQGLRGPQGEAIPAAGPVFDVTPAGLSVVTPPAVTRGVDNRAQVCVGADAARCPAAGPVIRVTGTTDSAFDVDGSGAFEADEYNSVIVYAGDRTTTTDGQRIATGVVADDGSFDAIVPLQADQPLTFTIEARDINPFPGKVPARRVLTVADDSIGPVVQGMIAVARVADPGADVPAFDIDIDLTFDEVVSEVLLRGRVGSGDLQDIDRVPLSADRTFYRWDAGLDAEAVASGVQIVAVATDLVGNVGPARTVGLSNLPRITTAAVLDEDTVTVTTTEAVTTERGDAAGFSIGGGPGVLSTSVSGTTITLALADPLEAGDFTVRYNGQGDWATSDERPLAAGTAPLTLSDEILFPVTGLAAGPTETGAVVSFVDERNDVDRVTGYEVSRNGTITDTLDADERILLDPDLDAGSYTYTVTVLGQDGLRSDPRSVLLQLGPSPVDEESREEAIGGGTGFPIGSEIIDDCPFPAAPNIGTTGGIVLSCDGRVAALVPAGVSSGPAYGAILRRTTVPTEGFDDVTDLYQLIAVEAAPGFPVVDDFDGFVELSFRALAPTLADTVTERVTTLRPFDGAPFDEKAARVGSESVATQLITVGSFGVVEADGASVRVFGPDPAVPADRFATAVSLSQTQYRTSTFAVLARADDYPDALAASPLAAQLGAPVLLSRSSDVPFTTLAELARLQTDVVYLVGGTAALSPDVQAQLEATGREVIRIAGPSRFDTAAAVARVVGSVDGSAFIATGATFADALAAAAPAAAIGRPILLAQADGLPAATRTALDDIRAVAIHLVGGEQAIAASVATDAAAEGFSVVRSSGATRYATAVALAQSLVDDGLLGVRQPVLASGEGDGRTSPDALAAGPISGRIRGVLLLTPRDGLPEEVAGFLSGSSVLRGLYLAGGEAAVTSGGRAAIDAAAGPPGAD